MVPTGGTDNVWFYDVQADGFTLDDKRTSTEANDLPDVLSRWNSLVEGSRSDRLETSQDETPLPEECEGRVPLPEEREARLEGSPESLRPRTAQSFLVPKEEIAANNYDLSLNRYKEVEHEEVEHRPPAEILAELMLLEQEIQDATRSLAEALEASLQK